MCSKWHPADDCANSGEGDSDVGKSEVGSRKSEVGSRKSEVGSRMKIERLSYVKTNDYEIFKTSGRIQSPNGAKFISTGRRPAEYNNIETPL